MFGPVSLEHPRNLWHQRIVRVRIRQQRANRQQHLRHREGWTPLVLQNIQADAAIAVHIAVVNPRREAYLIGQADLYLAGRASSHNYARPRAYLWWFKWVICWEMNVKEKYAACVWAIRLQRNTRSGNGTCRAVPHAAM